jgi:hypothetical protein
VHVRCPDGVVIVELDPVPTLREIHGDVKPAIVRAILESIAERQDECIAAWRKYHG